MQKPITHARFLADIEEFCRRHGMSERTFGLEALNDTALLHRLRSGASPTLQRVEIVYDYMIAREAGAKPPLP